MTVLGSGGRHGDGRRDPARPQLRGRQRRRPAAAPDGRDLRGRDPREAAEDLGLTKIGTDLWQTPALDTALVTMVGFTWRDGVRAPKILVRFRTKGGWSLVAACAVAPRPARSVEWRGDRQGRHLSTGRRPSDGVQVQVSGSVPPELEHHPHPRLGDRRRRAARWPAPPPGHCRARPRWASPCPPSTRAPSGAPTRPGATDRRATTAPSCRPTSTTAPPATAYRKAGDVPALIRSFYKYHTHSLGCPTRLQLPGRLLRDGLGRPLTRNRPARCGAHTSLGFNNSSTGFSIIGNFESASRPRRRPLRLARAARCVEALRYGRDPQRWTEVRRPRAATSSLGPGGLELPVIDGHRDTKTPPARAAISSPSTPSRAAAAGVITAATLKLKKPYPSRAAILGGTLVVADGKFKPTTAAVTYQWVRNGTPIVGAPPRRTSSRPKTSTSGSAWSSPAASERDPAQPGHALLDTCGPLAPGLLDAHPAQEGRQGDRALRAHRARRRRARRHLFSSRSAAASARSR